MRSTVVRASLALVLAGTLLPSVAEAANRRRVPRGGNHTQGAITALRSDETVQRALALTPAGGTAHLPFGAFRSAIVIDRPMHVVASPAGTTLDAATLGRPVIEILAGVTDVTIEGLRLQNAQGDGLAARGANDRLVLSRLVVTSCSADGARVAASDDVVIDRCSFEGNGADGLDVDGKGARISRSALSSGLGAAAMLRGEGATLSDGAFVGGAQGVVFAGKGATAIRNAFRGVGIAARFAASADTCRFLRNDVRGSATAVATELGSIYCSISDNRIAGASADAIVLLGTWHTVEGNDLSGLGAAGIVANGDSFHIATNRVDRAAGSAIEITGRGCMVVSNRLVAPLGAGLDIEGDGNVVALNDCSRAGTDAIRVDGDMNRVVANTAADAGGEGIVLAGDANTLQDDVLLRSRGNGIHVAGGVGNRAEGNAVTGCGGAGFLDEGVGTTLLRNRID